MKSDFQTLSTPALFVADHQTGGYGRFKRPWISPQGKNLYFTLLLQPDIDLPQYASLTQIAAISIGTFLNSIGIDATVKWPNDIYWNSHKICGMLAELLKQEDGSHVLSLGIGLNVNMDTEEFALVDRKASSLKLISGHTLNREILFQDILKAFFNDLAQFEQEGFAPFVQRWRGMKNFVGAQARIVRPDHDGSINEEFPGVIQGINDDGTLQFLKEDGSSIQVFSGDLEV